MALNYNIDVFRNKKPGNHLLASYSNLIAIELTLISILTNEGLPVKPSHNVPGMFSRLQHIQRLKSKVSVINSLHSQLSNCLTSLWTQGKDGNPAVVPANSYPNMRYFRHQDDWECNSSPASRLSDLYRVTNRVFGFIDKI